MTKIFRLTFKKIWPLFALAFLSGAFFSFSGPVRWSEAEKAASDLSRIIRYCRGVVDGDRYERCFYERSAPILKKYALSDSVKAMELLISDERFKVFESDKACHEEAHIVGEVGSENELSPARAFISCTRVCGFGCFHGVALGVMRRNPEVISSPDELCESFSGSSFPGQDFTACRHGLGHGFSDVASRDIRKALDLCKNFKDVGGEIECASGVFMELLEEPSFGREKVEMPKDYAAFCDTLDDPFSRMCRHKSGVYKFRESADMREAFLACRSLPAEDIRDCAFNIGADFYFMTNGDDSKIWPKCSEGNEKEAEDCVMGAIQSTFANDPTGEIGRGVCSFVEDKSIGERCRDKVSEIVGAVGIR